MSSDVYNRLSFLKSKIERHNKLYHGHDDPVISDKEFDNICVEQWFELIEIERVPGA